MSFNEQIRQAAKDALADLVGIAERERFSDLEDGKNPFTLFPQGRSVILVGRRITRGTLRGLEEGTNYGDFGMFGRSWLSGSFLAATLYETAAFIERSGFEALPLLPGPQSGLSVTVRPDFAYAAVACGIGEIGFGGEVLTPRFGPRQRFGIIVTDAKLRGDPLLQRSVCIRCGRCAESCPLGALDPRKTEVFRVCGKQTEKAVCNLELCRKCKNGAAEYAGEPDRLGALCMRTCVQSLGEAGALENRFETSFRHRRVWERDEYGELIAGNGGDDR